MAACSAAVYDSIAQTVLSERYIAMPKGHADVIAGLVREIMEEAKIGFNDLGLIGVTIGPGTFTGVRTGLAMARGLALSLNLPIAGIDTLSAIACNMQDARNQIAVAADARRGEVYFALFGVDLAMISTPSVLPVREAAGRLPDVPLNVLGTGADALIESAPGKAMVRSTAGDLPRASAFASRVARLNPDAELPEPLYLRPPDAKPQERFVGSPPAFDIRPASDGSAKMLAAMHAECFDNPWSAADMARLMDTPGAIGLVASEEGEPCGFLLARQAADEAEIITLGTRPFARRQGAARALMERLLSEIAQRRARSLFIEVANGNEPALGLYRTLGFANTGIRKDYYERPGGRHEDAVVMRKDLAT